MKIKVLLLTLFFFYTNSSWGQKKADKLIPQHNVSQLSIIKWDNQIGLPYKQVQGANLAATSFLLLSQNRIAFLCNSTSEIIITRRSDGKIIKRFNVEFAPRDFFYDNGFFYVLSEYQVSKYDENGKEISKNIFPDQYKGVERLTRYDHATFLLLPSGNSLMIDSGNVSVNPIEYEGTITNTGIFVATQIMDNNSYTVKLLKKDGTKYENTFMVDKKVAGVYVVGTTKNRVVIDIQTFLSETPISVERNIVSINLNENKLGAIVSKTKIPDCYFVLSNKEFYTTDSGNIINMVSTPSGVYVFSLVEIKKGASSKGYPASLQRIKYHFNSHLLKLEN